ncbi:MAG: hypothetical protein HYY60_00510 [Parcubacteria group bacterium]|nr:hypothetical protein [Parcubacteria group bacterium]
MEETNGKTSYGMQKILYSGLLLFFVLVAMVFLPPPSPARQLTDNLGKEITPLKAALPLVFGGRIIATIPCTCSGGLWISVGPPRPMAGIVYQVGVSVLFSFYSLLPSEHILGTYVPGGVCFVGIPPYCTSIATLGTIVVAGTSLLPLSPSI